jgi:hypothetical protein
MWKQVLLLFLFLYAPSTVTASFTFEILSVNPQVISDSKTDLSIRLGISDLPSPSYFRVAFQKKSGDPYFGMLKNHLDTWVPIKPLSADCAEYYLISDTQATSAAILLRPGDKEITPGKYLVKAHRLTEKSCSSTEATNNFEIEIAYSSISPSPIPPTNIPTPSPTKHPSPIPSPSPHVINSQIQIKPPTPTALTNISPSISPLVLSIHTDESTKVTPTPSKSTAYNSSPLPLGPIALSLSGFVILTGSILRTFRK